MITKVLGIDTGAPVMSESDRSENSFVLSGGCHCGAVRFDVQVSAMPVIVECNCSICSKSGYLHLIVPKSCFRLLSGEQSITTYRFNTGVARHTFCKVCGIKAFYTPRSNPGSISVNFRCLDHAPEIAGIRLFDGQNWEQARAALSGSDMENRTGRQ